MCEQGNTINVEIDGTPCPVDSCIADIVAALNEGGIPTVASCCGHNQKYGTLGSIALRDGRELVLCPDFAMARVTERLDDAATIARLTAELSQCSYERRLLARLAAETPQFVNPLEVAAAKHLRDKTLEAPQ